MKVLSSTKTVNAAVMDLVRTWADLRSKDPSTKVGACVIDPATGGLFLGYNGFPAGVADSQDIWTRRTDSEDRTTDECSRCAGEGTIWEPQHGSGLTLDCSTCAGKGRVPSTTRYSLTKYDLVIHAESNAVRKALVSGVNLKEATLVCTLIPCPRCMLTEVVACGIPSVIYMDAKYNAQTDRDAWLSMEIARLGRVDVVQMKAT